MNPQHTQIDLLSEVGCMGLVADTTPEERVQRSTVLRVEPLDQGWFWVRHCRLDPPEYIEPSEPQFGNPSTHTDRPPFAGRHATKVSKFAARGLYTL